LQKLGNLPIEVPDYTLICRRQKHLSILLPKINKGGNLHIVVDSSGLKVFGEGEWKVRKHGYTKRRTWRKIHLAVDADTQGIEAMGFTTNSVTDSEVLPELLNQMDKTVSQLSADGAYDTFSTYGAIEACGAKPVIPPRSNAKIRRHGNNKSPPLARDKHIRFIQKHGMKQWKRLNDYHRRSLAETAMFRFKLLFGSQLRCRKFENQFTEVAIKCRALNLMTELGMPDSYAA